MKRYLSYVFMDIEDAIRIHNAVIDNYGGRAGIHNKGLLESAIAHPWRIMEYGDASDCKIHNLAAIYFYHIIKNHPFIDGNKRTGLLTTIEFLDRNRYELKKQHRDLDSLYQLAIDTASSKLTPQDIALFFKKAIKKVK